MPISWKTEKRRISELVPYEHNPRQLTEKQYQDLKKSLTKFNLAEIPAVNRDNTILAGHQRLKILAELQQDIEIDVRVPSRQLTEREMQEYNIRSNKNTGEWDYSGLANSFDIEDLKDWGFEEKELIWDGNVNKINEMDEWEDMPEFNPPDDEYKIILHFESEEKRNNYAESKNLPIEIKQNKTWIGRP